MSYAKGQGTTYDPFDHYAISHGELIACGKVQGIDIRPASQGGEVLPGYILLIRSGWRETCDLRGPKERKVAALTLMMDNVGLVLARKRRMWTGCMTVTLQLSAEILLLLRLGLD
jgi:hypothetical protein